MGKVNKGTNTTESLEDLQREINELRADLLALSGNFNTHTHRADGAQAGQYNTSEAQSNAQTIVPVTELNHALASTDINLI